MRTLAEHVASVGQAPLDLARVLIIHRELAPRLTLRTLLEAGGYSVDVAATLAEGIAKLDASEYELVLSDSNVSSRRVGGDVLSYARVKEYRPATARIIFNLNESAGKRLAAKRNHVSVRTENVPTLLGKVADLIAMRAGRKNRPVRPGR